MQKLKIIKFWIAAFSVIIWQSIKGNSWHSVHLNIHLGDNEHGHPERKIIVARRTVKGLSLFVQHMPAFVPDKAANSK